MGRATKRSKKKLDDYIKKRIRDHDDPDKVREMTFRSVRKSGSYGREMPKYASGEEEAEEKHPDDDEERSKEEE